MGARTRRELAPCALFNKFDLPRLAFSGTVYLFVDALQRRDSVDIVDMLHTDKTTGFLPLAGGGKDMKNKWNFIVLAAAFFLPFIIRDEYHIRIVNVFYNYAVGALSINLIVGFCGQLDMGRSAFMGLGAYCSAILSVKLGAPFIVAFAISGVFSGLIGTLLGYLCRKSTFDYLTLVTVGFNVIVQTLLLNWIPVTGGVMGISRVPVPSMFGFEFDTNTRFYYIALVFLALSYITMRRICNSKLGRAFEAIRDDPVAAEYSGINV